MYSQPLTRQDLASRIPLPGGAADQQKAISQFIREQKAAGRLIERRVYAEPAKSKKRRQVFQFVAVNLELDL
jgi:hypothetical protein